jgi:hypothetical protein
VISVQEYGKGGILYFLFFFNFYFLGFVWNFENRRGFQSTFNTSVNKHSTLLFFFIYHFKLSLAILLYWYHRLYYGLHENSYGSILTIHYFCLTYCKIYWKNIVNWSIKCGLKSPPILKVPHKPQKIKVKKKKKI